MPATQLGAYVELACDAMAGCFRAGSGDFARCVVHNQARLLFALENGSGLTGPQGETVVAPA